MRHREIIIGILMILIFQSLFTYVGSAIASPPQETTNGKAVVLTVMFTDIDDPKRWPYQPEASSEELRKRNPKSILT